MHQPEVYLPIFAFAMLLGWIYQRTGRLASCVALHAVNNGLAVFGKDLYQTFSG